jgi:hypothetical protein
MSLSKEQVEAIDVYIKSELIDHMSCEIEETIEKNSVSFPEAFERVKKKWIYAFWKTSCFWTGMFFENPKIVIDSLAKAVVRFQRAYFFPVFLIYLLGVLFFENIKTEINTYFVLVLLIGTFLMCLGINLFYFFKIRSSNLKTTQRFIFKKFFRSSLAFFCFALLVMLIYDLSNDFSSFAFVFYAFLLGITANIICFKAYKSHFKMVGKYLATHS